MSGKRKSWSEEVKRDLLQNVGRKTISELAKRYNCTEVQVTSLISRMKSNGDFFKNPYKPPEPYPCHKCGRPFHTRLGRGHHEAVCKATPVVQLVPSPAPEASKKPAKVSESFKTLQENILTVLCTASDGNMTEECAISCIKGLVS